MTVMSPRSFARKMGKTAFALRRPAIRRLVNEAADVGVQAAREKTPVLTGGLKRSISKDNTIPASKAYARFGWSAEHAPMIIPGRRRSKSKKKGRFFGSTKTGRGNIAYRVRRTVDQRLGHIADKHIEKAL